MSAIQALQLASNDALVVSACAGNRSRPSARKGLRLWDLRAGKTARVWRVATADPGCRKRFAEWGLAGGMKVTIRATGECADDRAGQGSWWERG